jgi:hypothetical protein
VKHLAKLRVVVERRFQKPLHLVSPTLLQPPHGLAKFHLEKPQPVKSHLFQPHLAKWHLKNHLGTPSLATHHLAKYHLESHLVTLSQDVTHHLAIYLNLVFFHHPSQALHSQVVVSVKRKDEKES